MSFSSEQKAEIISQQIKMPCCRRAILQGMLASRAVAKENSIVMSVDSLETAEYAARLISEIYFKDALISTSKVGGRRRILTFESNAARKYISSFMNGEQFLSEKCPSCRSAFMRGIFLASGRVSDPSKQYSLEFSVGTATERIYDFLVDSSFLPRLSRKPKETLIYFRNSTQIEDFFAISGMNQTAFTLMNEKIKGEIRNNANRVVNCETNNIGKAVSASMNQISLIQELSDRGLLSQLPDELESTARLRMEHKDMSLSQLAAIITPPISKPGLSHRLKKISIIAQTLLHKSK